MKIKYHWQIESWINTKLISGNAHQITIGFYPFIIIIIITAKRESSKDRRVGWTVTLTRPSTYTCGESGAVVRCNLTFILSNWAFGPDTIRPSRRLKVAACVISQQ
jgi:hypothetical protein